MDLKFSGQKMLVASVTARSEMHGQDREPASDVGLEANLSNDVLNIFHPGLKGLLYYFDPAKERDLADQGKSTEAGFMPDLRFPKLGLPLKWDEEIAEARVTISVPGTKTEVVLEPAKVNKFALTPLEGGTISFGMRVQYKPDEKQAGKLAMLVQQEVEVRLEPIPPKQEQIPAETPPASAP